jgi:hypothetical protein
MSSSTATEPGELRLFIPGLTSQVVEPESGIVIARIVFYERDLGRPHRSVVPRRRPTIGLGLRQRSSAYRRELSSGDFHKRSEPLYGAALRVLLSCVKESR